MAELKIAPVPERNRQYVIELLEKLIVRVKDGEFDAVTILADRTDSERCVIMEAGSYDVATRLGRIRILEAELLRDALGG